MPNMSYCMFENTAGDLSQVVEAMYDAKEIDDLDLNGYEQEGFRDLYRLCKAYAILGTLGAIGIFYMKRTGRRIFEMLTQIPVINAEIVMALSLAVLFLFFQYGNRDLFTLVVGHIVLTISFVYLSVKPKLQQLDPSIYEAALDLGATPFKALRLVIFPQIFPGIVSGFVLAFTLSLDDFIITSFLKPTSGIDTLSTYVEAQLRVGIPPDIRALTT